MQPRPLEIAKPSIGWQWAWPALLVGSFLVTYAPMLIDLLSGPWQTEQLSQGPVIVAMSAWLVWRSRRELGATISRPAPWMGSLLLLPALCAAILSRLEGVLSVESLSCIAALAGCVLVLSGWPVLRIVAFPLGFLLFAVPPPSWILDAATLELKVRISDMVTRVLYTAGYPVAQNGVMIMIGPYQLFMKDACSGLNSIFALSAVGVFYAAVLSRGSQVRGVVVLAAILPIAIAANFLRVIALVLSVYYGGIEKIEGSQHPLTGIGSFVVAVLLVFLLDRCLAAAGALRKRMTRGS